MTTELILKIYQDELYEFFQRYDMLGDLQKEIWKKIVTWCKVYPCAFPCQSTIADELGCSRKHVNRTLKKFQEFGWIILISRGFKKAKRLFIGESYRQIDLINRNYFKRVEIISERTQNYSNEKNTTSEGTGSLAIPQYLEKLNISLEMCH